MAYIEMARAALAGRARVGALLTRDYSGLHATAQ